MKYQTAVLHFQRVSGFSDYFVLLNEDLRDDIIKRTEHVK